MSLITCLIKHLLYFAAVLLYDQTLYSSIHFNVYHKIYSNIARDFLKLCLFSLLVVHGRFLLVCFACFFKGKSSVRWIHGFLRLATIQLTVLCDLWPVSNNGRLSFTCNAKMCFLITTSMFVITATPSLLGLQTT